MNTNQNLQQLSELKLQGMKKSYQALLDLSLDQQPEGHEMLSLMIQAETQHRQLQRTDLLLRAGKLRYRATLDQITCSPLRNLTKDKIAFLADCSFIQNGQNILITGATGCGKSYLACALGNQACLMGYRTIYLNMNRFVEKIGQAKLDGTFIKLLNQLEKVKLLILDDFGLQSLDQNMRIALLQILEDRHQIKSTIIASQLPLNKWYEYIKEPTIADAIMDRLTENAHKIDLKGESLRKKKIN